MSLASSTTPLDAQSLARDCRIRWPEVSVRTDAPASVQIELRRAELVELCRWLYHECRLAFASLVVEEASDGWNLTYHLYGHRLRVEVTLRTASGETEIPSVSAVMHAADWHEREVEDLFGLHFEGHPRLGEFVLHEHWMDGVNPMRSGFEADAALRPSEPEQRWHPPILVEGPGTFVMPVGPIFSDFAEAAHFQLETVGEDVVVVQPRLFYKYRGVEKLAQGQTLDRVILLAERFSGTAAFGHALALCQAAETIGGCELPARARYLRTVLAELERLRHHAAAIAELCGSTALGVAQAQAELIEEPLLRLSGALLGHRFLFGLLCPGGLRRDLDREACAALREGVEKARGDLDRLAELLLYTSSFLDRIEEVGMISSERARSFGLVGPVARGSGQAADLRVLLPYAAYGEIPPDVPVESEGDGYARLRVLLAEARSSARIVDEVLRDLPAGPVTARCPLRPGAALGAVEAPIGATFHWLRLRDDGRVARYRLATPSFANWHGLHLAAENFAFQDFPIILATLGLSNAESDR